MTLFSSKKKKECAVAKKDAHSNGSGSLPKKHGDRKSASPPPHRGLANWSKSTSHLPAPKSSHVLPPRSQPNIVINHNYYCSAAPPLLPSAAKHNLGPLGSVVSLAADLVPMDIPHQFDDGLPPWHAPASRILNQGAACYDQLSSKLNTLLTLIDGDRLRGHERELFSLGSPAATPSIPHSSPTQARKADPVDHRGQLQSPLPSTSTSSLTGNYFAKVNLYANAKLPPDLPPMKLYIATYPLLTLAATYADRVYEQPHGSERFAHIDADWRAGTKAMLIKSVSMDDANTIVFAVRGTASFMDWAVNLNTAPTSPAGFLDDLGNLCHAGFLSVARKMIHPVSARLRQLLEEKPDRAAYSLLITGHSAGGAVASLLYMHMLSTSKQAESELNLLTGCFRRIHCITFGTPPVSLLPLRKPDCKRLRHCQFLSFVNEGDPVVRADKAYIKSLLELFGAPAPSPPRDDSRVREKATKTAAMMATTVSNTLLQPSNWSKSTSLRPGNKDSKVRRSSERLHLYQHQHQHQHQQPLLHRGHRFPKPVWKVPPATLSNAGHIIVLRSGDPRARPTSGTIEKRLDEGVVAQNTSDQQLRGIVWGDPVCHMMKLYAGRIETLAIAAVTHQR